MIFNWINKGGEFYKKQEIYEQEIKKKKLTDIKFYFLVFLGFGRLQKLTGRLFFGYG